MARSCVQVLRLSARSDAALQRQAQQLAAYLRQHPDLDLADVSYTMEVGQAHLPRRAAIVARDLPQAAERLSTIVCADGVASESASLVMMFPGQGAQYAGMGAQAWRDEPVFREHLDHCAEILEPRLGLDLRELLFGDDPAADEKLRETRLAQPAIFAVSYATAQLWRRWGLQPAAMVGHSIGEFVAATLAGVFELEHALHLVAERGALMQSMPDGGMLAVRLPAAQLAAQLPDGVEIAGLNAPQLTVVSGPRAALAILKAELTEQNIGATLLRTSHAFHSASMEKAAEAFARIVGSVPRRHATAPLLSARSGCWTTADDFCDPLYWARQMREPVRFVDAVRELLKTPGRVFLECGPGHGLVNAVRQAVLPGHVATAIPSLPIDAKSTPALDYLLGAAGKLYVAGVGLDAQRFDVDDRPARINLPGYPFAHTELPIPAAANDAAPNELPLTVTSGASA
jgi:phthiocerol/phenolphthiocerol synthesis type-I polyketide synthase E